MKPFRNPEVFEHRDISYLNGDEEGREPVLEWKNKLFFGDNLRILRDYVPDDSVDLIYLDPPFNSKATYNVLFKEHSGKESAAQIAVFEDTWHWNEESESTFHELVTGKYATNSLVSLIQAFRSFLGQNDMMAYLTMMAPRLLELHRVLKSSGNIFLHCDPTAGHYLKLLMDSIFGIRNFRNEIVWCYRKWSVAQAQFASNHDTLLFYSKTRKNSFNTLYAAVSAGTMKRWKGQRQVAVVKNGVRTASSSDKETGKTPMPDWWEFSIINPAAKERLGYPTQKPESLLERIILAGSNDGDIVLDPFCGCGTSVSVAEGFRRKWIGIDVTHLAISLIRHRLREKFRSGLAPYEVMGVPPDIESAKALALESRHQFQWWALGMVDGRPADDKKTKAMDRGVDGYCFFTDDKRGPVKRIVIQVKSGHVSSSVIRDLKGTIEREKASIGVLVTLEPPTREMQKEAIAAGFYTSDFYREEKYPRIQILTIEELLNGQMIGYPGAAPSTFKKPEAVSKEIQEELFPSVIRGRVRKRNVR